MSEKKWKIEYKDGYWRSIIGGVTSESQGFYEITFDGHRYGIFSKEAWDSTKTGEILEFVEKMLNDAFQLALKEHD